MTHFVTHFVILFAIKFELHKMTKSLNKFWISENRPVDHIGVLQTTMNQTVNIF